MSVHSTAVTDTGAAGGDHSGRTGTYVARGGSGGKGTGLRTGSGGAGGDRHRARAQLVRAAVGQQGDGLVGTPAKPEAMESVVKRAVKAGIPVITINSGTERSKALGTLVHVGQDEELAGEAVGEKLHETGRGKAECVPHEQGNVGHEQRCAGARETFARDRGTR